MFINFPFKPFTFTLQVVMAVAGEVEVVMAVVATEAVVEAMVATEAVVDMGAGDIRGRFLSVSLC